MHKGAGRGAHACAGAGRRPWRGWLVPTANRRGPARQRLPSFRCTPCAASEAAPAAPAEEGASAAKWSLTPAWAGAALQAAPVTLSLQVAPSGQTWPLTSLVSVTPGQGPLERHAT
jgi:hypothetical protein